MAKKVKNGSIVNCVCGATLQQGETRCLPCRYAAGEPEAIEEVKAELRVEMESMDPKMRHIAEAFYKEVNEVQLRADYREYLTEFYADISPADNPPKERPMTFEEFKAYVEDAPNDDHYPQGADPR